MPAQHLQNSNASGSALRRSGGRLLSNTMIHQGIKMQPSWITLLFLCLLARADKISVKEFCENESFNASCEHNQVIILNYARYGRMRQGRCVKLDYGHVGCTAEVLNLADSRCSGRRQCQIRIPDGLFARTDPCPEDLKPYLEADFSCIKVAVPPGDRCHLVKQRTLTAPKGYLASVTTAALGCGTTSLPWKIQGQPGQRINITLLDFALVHQQERIDSLPGPPRTKCRNYGVILERSTKRSRNITLCGDILRKQMIYTSSSNVAEIGLIPGGFDDQSPTFVMHYEVFGCPDISAPVHGWLRRSGNDAMVGCNNTDGSWKLQCVDSQWKGEMVNCSKASGLHPTKTSKNDHPLTYGSSILIIVAVALAIGLGVLVIGLICLRKQRHRLCGVPEDASLDSSDFSEDKLDRTYSTGHYGWATKSSENHASPAKDNPALNPLRIGHVGDIYDCTHMHDTQPCTPLLNKCRGHNAIYGPLRCTCPHTTGAATQPTYATRQSATSGGNARGSRPDSVDREDGIAGVSSHVGSHYFVLDPDVIADQRSQSVQLRTFAPPNSNPARVQGQDEEIYPMLPLKPSSLVTGLSGQSETDNDCSCPRPGPLGGVPVLPKPKNIPSTVPTGTHAQSAPRSQAVPCPRVSGDRSLIAGKENLQNNENERRGNADPVVS